MYTSVVAIVTLIGNTSFKTLWEQNHNFLFSLEGLPVMRMSRIFFCFLLQKSVKKIPHMETGIT